MVLRRAARMCHNDYKTIEKGCVSEMIWKLNLEPLNKVNMHKQTTHNISQGNYRSFSLTLRKSSASLRRTRHLNSKAYSTIHANKDCYKYSLLTRTLKH